MSEPLDVVKYAKESAALRRPKRVVGPVVLGAASVTLLGLASVWACVHFKTPNSNRSGEAAAAAEAPAESQAPAWLPRLKGLRELGATNFAQGDSSGGRVTWVVAGNSAGTKQTYQQELERSGWKTLAGSSANEVHAEALGGAQSLHATFTENSAAETEILIEYTVVPSKLSIPATPVGAEREEPTPAKSK